MHTLNYVWRWFSKLFSIAVVIPAVGFFLAVMIFSGGTFQGVAHELLGMIRHTTLIEGDPPVIKITKCNGEKGTNTSPVPIPPECSSVQEKLVSIDQVRNEIANSLFYLYLIFVFMGGVAMGLSDQLIPLKKTKFVPAVASLE
jgi:hypothetical protein